MSLWLSLLEMLLQDVIDAKNAQIDKEPANIEELILETDKLLKEGKHTLHLTNIMIAQMEQIIAKNAIESLQQN